jgi:MFS family permease
MATATESRVVYVAGLAQGIALVTFPAASTIFIDPADYGLSSTQYGAMFLPQVVMAIATSLLGAGLATRFGSKRLYLAGLACDVISMSLLIVSWGFADDTAVAYPILLVATGFLGAGFGLTVPALNTFAAAFHPDGADRAVLVLNALLGLGTALAPLFVAIFVGLGFWWGLPVLAGVFLVLLLVVSIRLPLRTEATVGARQRLRIPARFWLFAGFAVMYGICETMNGNWAQLDMTQQLGASVTLASVALFAFWGMVTVGRIGVASVERRFPTWRAYHLLPFVLAVALAAVWKLPDDAGVLGVIAFGVAGLGCSALLPLTISFGQEQLTGIATAVAGGVIAFYQVGYGIAVIGGGKLQDSGTPLPSLFGWAAVVALAMGLLSFVLARRPAHDGTPLDVSHEM